MADVFSAPIPGQSLTDEPRNFPWERPPEISDPDEAAQFHVAHMNKPEVLDNLLKLLQIGVAIGPLSKSMITAAQMDGIHSVDVGLIVVPVVREEMISIAEDAGIDYKLDDTEEDPNKDEEFIKAMVLKEINKLADTKEDDEGVDLMRDLAQTLGEQPQQDDTEAMPEMEGEAPMEQEEQPQMEQEAPVRSGLMARG